MNITEQDKKYIVKIVVVLATLLAVFLVVKIATGIKKYSYVGEGAPATNTISFQGEGEVLVSPDTAVITGTVRVEAKTMKEAQDQAATKVASAMNFLKDAGIQDKDIKTQGYTSYPKYETQRQTVYCIQAPCPQPDGKQVVIGYEVAQTLVVKVRVADLAGKIVDGLGDAGVAEISGPEFTVADPDIHQAEARKLAIDDAKAKAEMLSKDLGVKLVRIVSFSEGAQYPMYRSEMKMDMAAGSAVQTELPKGENSITSNVTITYEIR
jgi:hypothetical protein